MFIQLRPSLKALTKFGGLGMLFVGAIDENHLELETSTYVGNLTLWLVT